MLLVFGPKHGLTLFKPVDPGRHVVRSLMMLGMPLCYILSVRQQVPDTTMALFWTAPVLIVVFTAMAKRETGGIRSYGAAILAALGAIAILVPHPHAVLGIALPVGMATFFAVYVVMTSSMTRDSVPTRLFQSALWVFVSLTPVMPFVWRTPTIRGLISMTAVGLCGWVALWMLDRAIERGVPAFFAPALAAQPVVEMLLKWAVLGKTPSPAAATGALIIAGAVGMAFRGRGPRNAPEAVAA